MLPISERQFSLNGKDFTHYYVNSAPVACIAARDQDGRFLVVRQYRAPLDRQIIEFPAGKIDPGEDPAEGARRELEEETGYRAQRLRLLFRFYTTPGYSTELIHAFLAEGLTRYQTRFDPGEDIETMAWSADRIEQAISGGEIVDGKTILTFWALQKLAHEV